MFVSAKSVNDNIGYRMSSRSAYVSVNPTEATGETAFNSLTSKRSSNQKNTPMVFDSINQWQNFCHQRILGEKLNVIA